MHRCLEITEILLEIFELVFNDDCYPNLASLARTCRSFNGPALDVLWQDQSSLLPLVRCFPREILDLSGTTAVRVKFVNFLDTGSATSLGFQCQKFAKVPSVQDWERPSVYAKRIRILESTILDATVLQTLLQSCPSPPLLPNLRHLGIDSHHVDTTSGYDAYVASLFTSFSPKLLQSLQIECGLESNDTLYLLTQLPKHCAQIEFLYVSLLDSPSRDIAEYIASFASMRHLKSLDFTLVNSDSAAVSFHRPSSINTPNGFPSVIELSVNFRSTVTALDIFKAIHSTQLRRIDVCLPFEGDIANLREVLATITSRPAWKQSMRSISLTTGGCSMTANDVQGLLTFNHLRCLHLNRTGLVLDDYLLNDMAKAWPMLERLFIANPLSRSSPKATLNGLVPFSKHCPHISILHLSLDATDVPALANTTDAPRDDSRRGDRRLVLLVDMPSEICDPIGVASFLLNLFPRITVTVAVVDNHDEFQPAFLWRRVANIIEGTRK
ncbi:hypothetical protein PAXINDRAFT_101289 [Paxillus involutus ATCC 200175]|uniref:Unplaced genomic scaffold PAXINscaffold_44, whole genome shotgun sequence n=1 Tax=Paxillus involutus ATCC 200175 TaxID=664439 RepID=A0A0C9TYC1_PAXIN|nr:hypothetical protein PAXINDRAFT_101289 [Paxillus involutus ATCC 200175]